MSDLSHSIEIKDYTKSMSNPLTDISGFSSLVEYYETHHQSNWLDWLEFDKTFEKPGKQGLVGLLKPKQHIQGPNGKPLKYVFKISQYINYLVQHEYTVMKGLNEISPFCPHFCKTIGTIICEIDPKIRKYGNPFQITTKHPIEKEVLLTEYIDNSTKLYNYIKSDKIHERIIYSTIKQVLMAISIAQHKKKFTHYDLHSNNIMMKKCNKDVVFLYVLDNENQFCVPTHGHYPVIIDFGFSYTEDLNDGPAWPSMAHTDVGFMSDRFDPIADPKLFLVTLSSEMKKMRNNKKSTKFRKIVKNIFGRLNIDWEAGWDKGQQKGASDFITEMLQDHSTKSNLFDKYDHYCIDIIQSLIILPIEEQKYTNIDQSYKTFLDEFIKIEQEIGNPFYNLYILKGIVDVTREVRVDYLKNGESRQKAIQYFKQSIYERIKCIANYCSPKGIHFEKMLCSLLCFSKNIEGILYDVIHSRMKTKLHQYSKLPLQTTEQIYGALEANIPDDYTFNTHTTIFVMDCISEKCSKLNLTNTTYNNINKIPTLNRGSFLYKLYKKKKK
jgi:hypothetical protein